MARRYSDLSTTIASWTRKLSWSVLLPFLAIAPPSWSQQIERVEIVETPKVDLNAGTVKLRLKVYGLNNRPIARFEEKDFQLMVNCPESADCPTLEDIKWKNPQQAEPPESFTIVLLDFSGSMRFHDADGIPKLSGAINAIKNFSEHLGKRSGNKSHITIVPFGESGDGCAEGQGDYPVTEEQLSTFLLVGDAKFNSYFQYLGNRLDHLCSSTNIYEPLSNAVRFLGDPGDPRFHPPKDSNRPQPRLSIVLLSDGYHNRENEAQDFETLKSLLRLHPEITVHTLGYGLTPEELGEKCGLGRPMTRDDISICRGVVEAHEFVDKERLTQIATETGGIAAFSANQADIVQSLLQFLNALLGEYEIIYRHPQIDRAELYQVRVKVTSQGSSTATAEAPYTIPWVAPSLPPKIRVKIVLLAVVALVIGGFLPFWLWTRSIQRKYQ